MVKYFRKAKEGKIRVFPAGDEIHLSMSPLIKRDVRFSCFGAFFLELPKYELNLNAVSAEAGRAILAGLLKENRKREG
jgi:hypothetical protein